MREVESFCNHLSSDDDVGFFVVEVLEHFSMRAAL